MPPLRGLQSQRFSCPASADGTQPINPPKARPPDQASSASSRLHASQATNPPIAASADGLHGNANRPGNRLTRVCGRSAVGEMKKNASFRAGGEGGNLKREARRQNRRGVVKGQWIWHSLAKTPLKTLDNRRRTFFRDLFAILISAKTYAEDSFVNTSGLYP